MSDVSGDEFDQLCADARGDVDLMEIGGDAGGFEFR
jgi:hypothetical protein